jgi:hypothetical protein
MNKGIALKDLPSHLQARVAELDARAFSPIAPATPKKRTARGVKRVVDPNHWQGKEGDFQRETEAVLTLLGYAKRNKRGILDTLGKGGRKGWQMHISRAIGNPYVLDVLLFDHAGRCLEIELKTATGKLSDIQQALVDGGGMPVCRSLDEVRAVVAEWERRKKTLDAGNVTAYDCNHE